MTTRGLAAVLALVVLAGLATGCGDDAPEPAEATGVAWAAGDRIRLASGAERRVGDEVLWFAETVEGLAYLPVTEGGSTDSGDPLGSPLLLDDGRGEPVELTEDASRPQASPDGRWLAWNELDTERRQVRLDLVLYDVTTGERSEPFPPDTGLGVTRLTDTTAYVTTFRDTLVLDLATGRSRPARPEEDDVLRLPGRSSPDGLWRTTDAGDGVVSVDGEEVDLDLPGAEYRVQQWVDDDTVVGVVPDVPTAELDTGEVTGGALVACDVPSGRCAALPGVPARPAEVRLSSSEEPFVVSASGPSGYED